MWGTVITKCHLSLPVPSCADSITCSSLPVLCPMAPLFLGLLLLLTLATVFLVSLSDLPPLDFHWTSVCRSGRTQVQMTFPGPNVISQGRFSKRGKEAPGLQMLDEGAFSVPPFCPVWTLSGPGCGWAMAPGTRGSSHWGLPHSWLREFLLLCTLGWLFYVGISCLSVPICANLVGCF